MDDYWSRIRLSAWIGVASSIICGPIFLRLAYIRITRRAQWDQSALALRTWRYFVCISVTMILMAGQFTVLFYLPCAAYCDVRSHAISTCVGLLSATAEFLFYGTIVHRLRLVEAGFAMGLGSWLLTVLRYMGLLLWLLPLTISAFSLLGGPVQRIMWALLTGAQAMLSFFFSGVVFWAISRVRRPAVQAAAHGLSAYTQAERAWVRDYLASTRVIMVLPLLTDGAGFLANCLMLLYEMRLGLCGYGRLADALFTPIGAVTECVCLFLLVGEFRARRPRFKGEAPRAVPIVSPRSCSNSDAWNAKVAALAGRGISVSSLLDFFDRLGPRGGIMRHFDPRRSTTNDVVRQAIIPLSRCGHAGLAYAELFAPEGRGMPASMVTHTWGCCFAALVAAVVADALGDSEYGSVLADLEQGRTRDLRQQLEGSAHKVYWICAFCVNQHAGICGGFGPAPPPGSEAHARWDRGRRDSVTGKPFPLCACRHPKFFNDNPEECEMNKFDDMMAELGERVPDLQHVIVVDPDFKIFTRAWCIAELVQGSVSQIHQEMVLMTRKGIDLHSEDVSLYTLLARLTVADCEASLPEDKDLIMSRILNVRRFDAYVQDLIFGDAGLARKTFVGFGLLDAAVRTSRRIASLTRSELEEAWSSTSSSSDESA